MTKSSFRRVIKKLKASAKEMRKANRLHEHAPKEDSFFWRIEHIAPITEIYPLFWSRTHHNGGVTCKHNACNAGCSQMVWRHHFTKPKDWDTITKPGIGYIYIERKHWLRNWLHHMLFQFWSFITEPIEKWLEHQIKDFWADHQLDDDDKPASKEYNRFQWFSRVRWTWSPAQLAGCWHKWEIRAIHPAKITKFKRRRR
jgi:hypothetical protein